MKNNKNKSDVTTRQPKTDKASSNSPDRDQAISADIRRKIYNKDRPAGLHVQVLHGRHKLA